MEQRARHVYNQIKQSASNQSGVIQAASHPTSLSQTGLSHDQSAIKINNSVVSNNQSASNISQSAVNISKSAVSNNRSAFNADSRTQSVNKQAGSSSSNSKQAGTETLSAIRSKIMKKNELVVNKISISEQVSPDIEQMMIIKCLSSEWSLETACYCKFSKTFMYKMLSMKTGFCENIHFQILVMEILKTEL